MTWILLAVMVAFMVIDYLSFYMISQNPMQGMPPAMLESLNTMMQFPDVFNIIFYGSGQICVLLLIILVASSIGNEYGWGSVRQVMTRKGIRYQYVTSKLVSLTIVSMIGLILAVAVGFILSVIINNLEGGINWDFMTSSFIVEQLRDLGWTALTIMPYVLMSAFFAFWGRSVLAGIGGGLGFYFVEQILVAIFSQTSGWLADVPNYLLSANMEALVPSGMTEMNPFAAAGTPVTTTHAAVTLGIYCVAFIILSLIMFKKRDISV